MDAAQETRTSVNNQYKLIAEIDPPKGVNLDTFLDTALQIRGRVDGARVTDSEHAIMRMSPIAPCLALKEKGFEPEMIITGRDRNRISFQADLLSAAALGIRNIIIKEGHDPAEGDQPVGVALVHLNDILGRHEARAGLRRHARKQHRAVDLVLVELRDQLLDERVVAAVPARDGA